MTNYDEQLWRIMENYEELNLDPRAFSLTESSTGEREKRQIHCPGIEVVKNYERNYEELWRTMENYEELWRTMK